MLTFPNAKINIGLFITEKRTDGYHNLETIFYPILGCKDALEIIDAEKDELVIHGKEVVGDLKNNLIYKALEMVRSAYERARRPIKMVLYKSIPMGAGLGGGSSDACFMLKLLNDHFKLGSTKDEMLEWALRLGSDCPFFLKNRPVFATGRGEKMTPIEVDLSNYSIQLVCPDIHVSTADAFQGIKPKLAPNGWQNHVQSDVNEWHERIHNDFEVQVFMQYPILSEIKQALYDQGALYATMSGTGSTIYGIFPKSKKAEFVQFENIEVFYQE